MRILSGKEKKLKKTLEKRIKGKAILTTVFICLSKADRKELFSSFILYICNGKSFLNEKNQKKHTLVTLRLGHYTTHRQSGVGLVAFQCGADCITAVDSFGHFAVREASQTSG